MPPTVKGRAYDNSARSAASAARRALVLTAARRLFLERGYVRTTMPAIAHEAGVAVDTVYELVGRKPDLFRMLMESAISGRDEAVPADERDYVRRIQDEPTAVGKLRIYAAALPAILGRLTPLVTVVQAAASVDPALGDLWREIAERRAANMHRLALELHTAGGLAVTVERAADIIWATNAPEVYTLLVTQRGWTPEQYGDWLADSWERLLLDVHQP